MSASCGSTARPMTSPPPGAVATWRSSYDSGGDVEHLGQALALLDLDQQHPPPAAGQRDRERGRDGGLARRRPCRSPRAAGRPAPRSAGPAAPPAAVRLAASWARQ